MSSFYTTGDTKLKGKPLLSNDVSAPVWEKMNPFFTSQRNKCVSGSV